MEESRLVNWIVDEGIGVLKEVTRARVADVDLCECSTSAFLNLIVGKGE